MKTYQQPVGEGLSRSKKKPEWDGWLNGNSTRPDANIKYKRRHELDEDGMDETAREHAKDVRCPVCYGMAVVVSGRVALAHKTSCVVFKRKR